ncbi:hypothetical protein [Paludisphaera rhizosphaerae]|uniref:hypothetical protein n=1 Tax=Paludisphaera rhizosphaerae TaxID=2711216 RepID=UPI0013EAFF34|nr:hypothetical protein [Paludisphaera rhizosphaerae]
MKLHLLGLALGALVGSFVLGGEASACHLKLKKCSAPTCAPAPEPVCVPTPPPCPPPVVETCAPAPKKHCFGGLKCLSLPKFKGFGCHKSAPVETCTETVYAPAAVYAAPQAPVYAAPQASGQN